MIRLVVAALCLGLWGCGEDELRVELPAAAGLVEGSPVQMRGVRVGEVQRLALVEGAVTVSAEVESRDDLRLRSDACAAAGGEPPRLVIVAGVNEAPLDDEAVLPACSVGGLAGQLTETAGAMLRGLEEALAGAKEEEATSTASSPTTR